MYAPKGGGGGYQIISWNEKIAGCSILKHGALFINIFFYCGNLLWCVLGDGSEGQQTGLESGCDNTNEDGWLRPAYLHHLIGATARSIFLLEEWRVDNQRVLGFFWQPKSCQVCRCRKTQDKHTNRSASLSGIFSHSGAAR